VYLQRDLMTLMIENPLQTSVKKTARNQKRLISVLLSSIQNKNNLSNQTK